MHRYSLSQIELLPNILGKILKSVKLKPTKRQNKTDINKQNCSTPLFPIEGFVVVR